MTAPTPSQSPLRLRRFSAALHRLIFLLAAIGPVAASGQSPPGGGLVLNPDPVEISLRTGETATSRLQLANPTAGSLGWRLEIRDANGLAPTLEAGLAAISGSGDSLNGLVPTRYDFSEGTSGSSIQQGAPFPEIYRTGNFIHTNLGGPLTYTNNHVATSAALGSGGRYFTHKLPGLFVFSGETNGISHFEVAGRSNFTVTTVLAHEFETQHAGTGWSAFLFQARAYTRTINQLILVDQRNLVHTTSGRSTDQLSQKVSGLSGKRRVHYLLSISDTSVPPATSHFETLAGRMLETMPQFGGEIAFSPVQGSLAAGASREILASIDATDKLPATWTGTLAAVSPGGGTLATVPLSIDLTTPRLELPEVVEASALPGMVPQSLRVPILSTLETELPWSASIPSPAPWLSLEKASGNTPEDLVLRIDAAGLAAGLHSTTVRITSGPASFDIPVRLQVSLPSIHKFLANPRRPVIYALHTDGKEIGSLIEIDVVSRRITRSLALGKEPTDLDLTEDGSELVVINTSDPSLSRVRVADFTVVETIPLSEFSNRNEDRGGHVKCGAGSIIYYVDEQWGPRLRVFDAASRTVIQTLGANSGNSPNLNNDDGFGDIALSPDRQRLFGWKQYGDGAGSSGTYVVRFDVRPDGTLDQHTRGANSSSTNFQREPFETPVLVSRSGNLIIKDREIDPENLDVFPVIFPQPIYAITPHAEIAVSHVAIHSIRNGETLADLPATTRTQAVSSDYTSLIYFDSAARALGWIDLRTTPGHDRMGLAVAPADGTFVSQPDTLRWLPVAGVTRYFVYLGTDRAAVEAATPSSPEFLGETHDIRFPLGADLDAGQTYHWRVVPVDADGNPAGTAVTRSFGVTGLQLGRTEVEATVVQGVVEHSESVSLDATSPISWSAETEAPWIRLATASGATPGALSFAIDASGLAPGFHSATIRLQADGNIISLPVTARVVAPDIVKLVPHPQRQVVYGLHRPAPAEPMAQVIEIDATDASMRRALPLGQLAPTDASLDVVTGKLFVASGGNEPVRVIDVDDWQVLPPLDLGGDIYKINATPDGRLVVEGEDQWIRIAIRDAVSGESLGSSADPYFAVREGDGEADSTGSYYYRCDNNSSGARVRKYDISGNQFVEAILGPQIGYGSRNLILSGDGSRLFWLGRVLDESLAVLAQMPGEIHATTGGGELAVGAEKIWWSDSGIEVASLPFSSTVAAVSADNGYLLRFDAASRRLHTTPVSSFTDLPGPWPRPGQLLPASPPALSWSPVDGATGYRLFLAGDAAALAAMTAPTAETATAGYTLPTPLPFGLFYVWRVDVVTPGGVVPGTVHTFGIAYPEGPPLPQFGTGSSGIAASLSERHLLVGINGSAQLYDFDAADGRATALQSFSLPGYYGNHYFGAAVAMDNGKAAVGAYAEGSAYLFQPGPYGNWEHTGPLTPPDPLANERFGRAVAAAGNLMLVGAEGTSSAPGRVVAYLTEPDATAVQTFSAADGVAQDGFGVAIAMEGNRAVIAAKGPGSSFNRVPSLYAFNRSTSTGLWSQAQKFEIPGSSVYGLSSGPALALSGNTLASSNGANSVVIFTRNRSGQWVHSTTIAGSGVPNSSSQFGRSLALLGDQLFIGDPAANPLGSASGGVFTFRRSGSSWVPGPVITPRVAHLNFGSALAVRDHWLAVAGGSSQPAWLFRISETANRVPVFTNTIPTQVVAGREFSFPVHAADPDGNEGLTISKLQAPLWLRVTQQGDGQALLEGTAPLGVGQTRTLQLLARDAAGGETYYATQVTVLDPSDVPVFTESPPSELELGVGQELSLRTAVSGTGPFEWQWWHNGEPIPGANGPVLHISEVGMENAGTYQLRVRNAVDEAVSGEIEVTIRPANRFAGDWPTLGSSPSHTGRHPAALDSTWFRPAWEAPLHGYVIHQVAIADGRVVAAPQSYFASGAEIHTVDLETGAPLWTYPLPSSFSTNPPTLFGGSVYFQRGKGTGGGDQPQLIRLNAADGAEIWKSPFGAQWERYKAPAVSELGIFINGGTYGGMYGFNHDGTERFFERLPQTDNWAPTLAGDRLFSWVDGNFIEHNPNDGTALWNLFIGGRGPGHPGMNTVAAVSGNSAAVIGREELSCIDLPSRSLRWQVVARHLGSPAIGDGRVFAILGDAVVSYALSDGTPGPVYSTGGTALTGEQPILFNDRLAVSNASKTWIFDLASGSLHQTLDAGGFLSYSNGYLLAAGSDGTLRAFTADPHGRVALAGPDATPIASDGPPFRVGAPPVGSASVTPLTVSNSGIADLGALEWRFEGENAGDFAITNTPATTLAPGVSTQLVVTHTPSAKGMREALLILSSDDPARPEFRLPIFALPPEVEVFAASDITGVSATLNGAVAALGNGVEVVFEYGLTDAFGTTVSGDPAALSGDEVSAVSAAISGLPPGTLHHFRVGATNAHGTHWSEGQTFTTLSDNARLSFLIPAGATLSPAFDPETGTYLSTVSFAHADYQLRPITEHPGATVEIGGLPVPSDTLSPPMPLEVGNQAITTLVTAEDGITTLAYTVVVTRLPEFFELGGTGGPAVSADGFTTGNHFANLRLRAHPAVGESLMVVENTSLHPIVGEFGNLAQGQRITLGFEGVDYEFVVNYHGGSGNDLILHWADTALHAWGLNSQAQLGDGTSDNRSSIVPAAASPLLDGATLIDLAAGYLHSLALLSDGTVAAWGYGPQGQLGHGGSGLEMAPVAVRHDGVLAGRRVVAIAAGAYHNLALCADGTLVAWGYNNHGQLGDGTTTTRTSPVAVRTDGALAGKRVVAIAAGSYHSLALCSDGTIAAWGYNDEGELGDGTTTSHPEPVAVDVSGPLAGRQVAMIRAGQYHSLALCTDGTLAAWGYNGRGQLGDGTTADRHSPVAIGESGTLAGKIITDLAAGGMHSLALAADGSILAWGSNRHGEIGPDHPTQSNQPVPTGTAGERIGGGAFHSLALEAATGRVTSWGRNHQGQLAHGLLSPMAAPAPADAAALPSGTRLILAASGPGASHNLAIVALPGSSPAAAATAAESDEPLWLRAFGLEAGNAAPLPRPVIEDGSLVLRFDRTAVAAGFQVTAEWSPNLNPGSWQPLPDTGNAAIHQFNLRLADHPAAFMRLRIEERD